MSNVLITVTQEHIDAGKPFDDCLCPEALAIREVVADDVKVNVTGLWVGFWKPGEGRRTFIEQPPWAVEFVLCFDGDLPPEVSSERRLEPFSYVLDIPDRYLPKKESANGESATPEPDLP